MKRVNVIIIILISIIIVLSVFLVIGQKRNSTNGNGSDFWKNMKTQNTREPAAAGQFYPADPSELSEQILSFLAKAEKLKSQGKIAAIIVPHAGYQFSGQNAAFAFKQLTEEKFDTIIIMANSHHNRFPGVSVFPEGFYKTPLGEVGIDSELAKALIASSDRIFFEPDAHRYEHAIEVELPFLQKTLKDFKIVPLLFGNVFEKDYQIVAEAIAKSSKGKKVLVVASSDLSHYPAYEDAQYADRQVIKAILSGEIGNLEKTITELEKKSIPNIVTFACGIDAIKAVMAYAKIVGAGNIKLLKYSNSGDSPVGSKEEVVGYGSIAFFHQDNDKHGNGLEEVRIDKSRQAKLLNIARVSVEGFVKKGIKPSFKESDPVLNQRLGAFVTIKKDGRLRGCIGVFSPAPAPLYEIVSEMAIAAAVEDNRFQPVSEEELPYLSYEISVLSPLKKIDNWRQIKVGEHGVEIRRGSRKGVFLPQVAEENNLSLEEFLSELCFYKAGLEPDCYKDKNTEIYIFTAQVFSDKTR